MSEPSEKKEQLSYRDYSRRVAEDFTLTKIFWQRFSHIFTFILFTLFYRLKIYGKENIPKKQRCIIAPNHTCYFDPFMMSYATHLPIAFMAKKELFEVNRTASSMLDGVAAFAVNRENLELSTMKTAKEVFKAKSAEWCLGIFPQGGIRTNKKIEDVTKGFAVIAKSVKYDILPVSMTGCEDYNWDIFKRPKVEVRIGKLISHEKEIDEIIEDWRNQLATMSGYELVDEPVDSEKLAAST